MSTQHESEHREEALASASASSSSRPPRHYPASVEATTSSTGGALDQHAQDEQQTVSGPSVDDSNLPEPPHSLPSAQPGPTNPLSVDVYSHSLLSQSYGRFFDFSAPPSASSPARRRQDDGGFAPASSHGGSVHSGSGAAAVSLDTLLPPRRPAPLVAAPIPARNQQRTPTPTQAAGADTYHSHTHCHGGGGGGGGVNVPTSSSSGSATPLTSNLALLLGSAGSATAAAGPRAGATGGGRAEEMIGRLEAEEQQQLGMPSLGCTPSSLPDREKDAPRADPPSSTDPDPDTVVTPSRIVASDEDGTKNTNTVDRDDDDDEEEDLGKDQHTPRPGRPIIKRNKHTYSPESPGATLLGMSPAAGSIPAYPHPGGINTMTEPIALGSSAPGRFLLPPGTRIVGYGNSKNYQRQHQQRVGDSLTPSIVDAEGAGASVGVGAGVVNSVDGETRRSSTSDIIEPYHIVQRQPSREEQVKFEAGTAHYATKPRSADSTLLFEDTVRRCQSVYEMRQGGTISNAHSLSSSPYYTDMLHRKRAIEATLQQRLAQRRETSMRELVLAQNQMERRMSPRPLSPSPGDDIDQSQGSHNSSSVRMTNETRKCRRAEHNRAVVSDLCEIVADLFLAESRLLNPTAPDGGSGIPIIDGMTPDRDSVLSTVAGFLSDLPVRYALGVDSPSEVLVHMRLMTAARADSKGAAVHIGNVDDGDGHVAVGSVRPGSKLRLVTICCADRDGLLEFITKLLGTGGARVVDADVMLTRDNIALDRFVVEMKGRLRLDKLQQYIESYLSETSPSNASKKKQKDANEEKKNTREPSKSRPPKPSESAPVLPSLSSRDRSGSGSAYGPLYFHPPKRQREFAPQTIRREMQSAMPLSELVSSGSQANVLPQQQPGGRVFRQQQADPLSALTRPLPRHDRAIGADGSCVSSGSPTDQGQATGESGSESPPTPPVSPPRPRGRAQSDVGDRRQRQMLVNREATVFSNSPEHGIDTLPEDDVSSGPIRPSGVAVALASQSRPRRVVPIIPFDELMLIETLGTGRISTIYRAAWQMSQRESVAMVALKVATIDPDSSDKACIEELRREADIAAMLDHKSICSLVGVASDPECFCLAYEFCEGGSLLSLLSDTSRCYEYLPIALDIANGMAYLHSRNVIHRDLKPSNVLLTRDSRAKIADFGMSVAMTGQELTAETGTYRWMAPEVIRHESYSSNADVYSFGIVLWQLITREVPFATLTPVQTAYAVAEGHRPEIPRSTPEHLRRIIEACWDEDSQKRPSFTYIAMALADYAKLAFNPANVGAQTVQIANEMLANVQGNSTVNVDFSTPVSIGGEHRRHSSIGMASRADSSPGGVRGNWFGPSSYSSGGTGGGNIGLEI